MSDVINLITGAATRYGIDPRTLVAMARLESSLRPHLRNPNSSAGGLFQFIDGTARQYGLVDRYDPAQASDAAARLARDNTATLRRVLGRDPTPGEVYLAHQQGGKGAADLLTNPDRLASDIVGTRAVLLNGGQRGMTAGQFADLWNRKMERKLGIETPEQPTTVASNFAPPATPAPGAMAPRVPGDLPPLPTSRPAPQPGSVAGMFASSEVSDPMSMPPSGSLGGPSPFSQPSAPPAPAPEPVVASVAPSTTPAPVSAGGMGANIGSLLAGLFQQGTQPQQPQRNPAVAAALFTPPDDGASAREAEAEAILRRRRLAGGGAAPVLANLFA